MINKQEMLSTLGRLPKEFEAGYNSEIRKLSLESDPADARQRITLLEDIAFDTAIDDDVAFSAFMIALHNHRRRNKSAQTRALLVRGEPRFKTRKLFQLHQATAGATRNPANFQTAISIARVLSTENPNEPGILNAFSELVVRCLEDNILSDNDGFLLKEARQKEEAAMANAPSYAKYRATFARILLLEGQYDLAKQAIDAAIELEDDLIIDYNIRLANYLAIRQRVTQQEQTYKLGVSFEQARNSINLAIESTKKEIEESRTKNIEVLAFFSSIIALILTGAQEAKSLAVNDSQLVLLLLSGVLMLSFCGLSLILYQPIRFLKTISLLALAIVTIGASIYLTYKKEKTIEIPNKSAQPAVAPLPSHTTGDEKKKPTKK